MTAVLAILTLAAFLLLFAGVGMAIKHKNVFWALPYWITALLVQGLAEFCSGHPWIMLGLGISATALTLVWAVAIVVQAHILQRRSERPQEPPPAP
jgi:hypothetical protein